ncbi:MobA/MobL family protein, partial [Faecalibacterium duncaniae]
KAVTKDSTLSFFNRTDQAQRRSERHCQRSLSSRGASLQQLLWRSQRLHQKGGVIASEIMLPPHAPEIYLVRATLWNAVENCEKHPKAQLAYSFDIAMQNELTLEENMELARKFVQEQFVTKGMIADLAFHSPEKEDGGIPNPHFHVMTTMRPLNPVGTWGQKQRREYLLDEDGNRIRDKNGDYMFNAVHTTDWHEPETLEHWREQWAAAVNTKFEEKGLDVRIDH